VQRSGLWPSKDKTQSWKVSTSTSIQVGLSWQPDVEDDRSSLSVSSSLLPPILSEIATNNVALKSHSAASPYEDRHEERVSGGVRPSLFQAKQSRERGAVVDDERTKSSGRLCEIPGKPSPSPFVYIADTTHRRATGILLVTPDISFKHVRIRATKCKLPHRIAP
jgi:hypothetical protein